MHVVLHATYSLCCTTQNAKGEDTAYLGVDPLDPRVAVLYSPVEVHRQHELRAGLLPGVSMPEPVVCLFYLQEGYGLECIS